MKIIDSVYHSNSVSFVRGQNGISEDYLWQSLEYLFDTLLEGMKCEWDLRRSLTLNRHLLALKNWLNGDFILRVNSTTNKQHFFGNDQKNTNPLAFGIGIRASSPPDILKAKCDQTYRTTQTMTLPTYQTTIYITNTKAILSDFYK